MPAKKRAADAADAESPRRATKAAKNGASTSKPSPGKAKKGKASATDKKRPKNVLPPSRFLESALPLHIHITSTPPSVGTSSTSPNKASDKGHIASLALLPTTFSTGSYGWKGSKPVTVEVEDKQTGKTFKMKVQLGINAPVNGSKDVTDDQEEADEDAGDEDDVAEALTADEPEEDDDE